jgi:hypothetical protein
MKYLFLRQFIPYQASIRPVGEIIKGILTLYVNRFNICQAKSDNALFILPGESEIVNQKLKI